MTLLIATIATAVVGAAVGATFNDLVRFNNEIRGNECGIIIKWARGESGPGVKMNFKTKFDDNWNHENLDAEDSNKYTVDMTRERVDGGKLERIDLYWDKVSDTIRGIPLLNFWTIFWTPVPPPPPRRVSFCVIFQLPPKTNTC